MRDFFMTSGMPGVRFQVRLFLKQLPILLGVVAGHPHSRGEASLFSFNTMVAHWAEYDHPDYLSFVGEARPELAQVGFYGAHFWSLAHTEHGGGYPAHFPKLGHDVCGDWFHELNRSLHQLDVKVVGHLNVKFLIGDPEGAEGPRGFFDFYENHWDPKRLGSKPVADPRVFLERDADGKLKVQATYKIGGMREYWACLNHPAWREILKRWVKVGVERGLDGFIVNYFYRHDCHCQHCVSGFKNYLAERHSEKQLRAWGISDLRTHQFSEIPSWHDPEKSTPLRREALRFSQIANKRAFDEVFVDYGRRLKSDLIVAQWNHLGAFSQISGDERCLLPSNLWAKDEDYLWYSTGGAANATDLAKGNLGEATLQARYIQGASGNKAFTLGKYEHVRIRTAIAELIANGGAPMGFYTRFTEPEARREIVRYYQFIRAHKQLYQGSKPHAEVTLLFPRQSVWAGDLAPLERFKKLGRQLLDEHVLFDVVPDDVYQSSEDNAGTVVIDPSIDDARPIVSIIPEERSQFTAPETVRVSASRTSMPRELVVHLVNYHRRELPDLKMGAGIRDENPIPTPVIHAALRVPNDSSIKEVMFLTPESLEVTVLPFRQVKNRVAVELPTFLVYGVLRIQW